MLKNILGVIAGYAVFAVGSVLYFNLTKQPAHADASNIFMIATLGFGITISVIGGYVTYLITGAMKANFALAVLIFTLALFSMIFSDGAHWTQWFAMLFFCTGFCVGRIFKAETNRSLACTQKAN